MSELPTALIRLRLGQEDAHYGGNLVAGATQLKIVGDLGSDEYTIRFATVSGLEEGNPVQLNGVIVGKVEEVVLPKGLEQRDQVLA